MGIRGNFFLEGRLKENIIDSLRYVRMTEQEEDILNFLRFFVSAYEFREKLILESRTMNFARIKPWKTKAEILNHLKEILNNRIEEVSGHDYAIDNEKISDSLKALINKGLIERQRREEEYRITAKGVVAIAPEIEEIEEIES